MKFNLKSGTYYIGDPCLIIKGTPGYQWIEKLWTLFYKIEAKAALIEVQSVRLFIGSTYEGDGFYDGISVDTGTIAIIRINDLIEDERFNFNQENIKGTKTIIANENFTVNYDNGVFQIGDYLTINTKT